MTDRLDPFSVSSEAIKALVLFDASTRSCRLETSLVTLAKLRVSMMIGSLFCVDRYIRDGMANGETIERLRGVRNWRGSALYSRCERAALEWAEVVARAAETQVPDKAYRAVEGAFTPEQLVALTAAIASATAWNQIAMSFRLPPSECAASRLSASS